MFDSLFFTNVNGESFDLNDGVYAMLETFNTSVEDRTTEREKSLQHGIWPAYTYLGKRTISAEGHLYGNSPGDYITRRRAINRVFTPRPQFGNKYTGTLYVVPTGLGDTLSIQCTPESQPEMPIAGLSPQGTPYQINLKAFDPRFYGTQKTTNVYPPSDGSGRTYGKTFPLTYVGTGTAQDILVNNLGDIETYPSARIYGACTGPQLVLFRSDGKTFIVKLDGLVLGATDYVDIDFKYRTVVNQYGQNLYSYATGSQWWALEPGNTNTVRFTAASYSTAYAAFKWQDAYML